MAFNGSVSAMVSNSQTPSARREPGDSLCTPPDLRAHLVFWSVTAAGFTLDLWSKKAVFEYLQSRDDPVSIIAGFLQLRAQQNPGAAFGIATGQPVLLVSISIIAIVALLALFLLGKIHGRLACVALALFSAGVLGNLHDRLFNSGCVRDFIDVYYKNWHWPTFNLADTMLCIAVGILIISGFFKATGKACQRHAQQQK